MHDDAAYVPPEMHRALGRRRIPCAASRPGCASTRSSSDDELGAMEHDVEAGDRRRGRARRGQPPGPIPTRSRMASTPTDEAERARRARSRCRATAPGSTTSCAARARCSCCSIFRLSVDGRSRTCPPQGGVVLAPMHRSYTRHARRRRLAEAAALPRDGQVRALLRAAGRARDRAGRRLPGAPWRAGHGGLRDGYEPAARRRTCCSSSRKAHATATARLGRSWAPPGSRSRPGVPFVPVAIARHRRIKLLPPRFPRSTCTTVSRSRSTTFRPTISGARRTPRPSAGRTAIEAGAREPLVSRSYAQAARWSSKRWRCSCSQDWCHARTRAA